LYLFFPLAMHLSCMGSGQVIFHFSLTVQSYRKQLNILTNQTITSCIFFMFFSPLIIHLHLTTSCMGSRRGSYFQPTNQWWAY
jgi:hypothetical protein